MAEENNHAAAGGGGGGVGDNDDDDDDIDQENIRNLHIDGNESQITIRKTLSIFFHSAILCVYLSIQMMSVLPMLRKIKTYRRKL